MSEERLETTVRYDQAARVYRWRDVINHDLSGTAETFEEARWYELFTAMHQACMRVLANRRALCDDDLIYPSVMAVLNKFQREPNAARQSRAWICYRAVFYLRARLYQRLKTKAGADCSIELLTHDNGGGSKVESLLLTDPASAEAIEATDSNVLVADLCQLFKRESHKTVFTLLSTGATHREIADVLHISHKAVEYQIKTIKGILMANGGPALLRAA